MLSFFSYFPNRCPSFFFCFFYDLFHILISDSDTVLVSSMPNGGALLDEDVGSQLPPHLSRSQPLLVRHPLHIHPTSYSFPISSRSNICSQCSSEPDTCVSLNLRLSCCFSCLKMSCNQFWKFFFF